MEPFQWISETTSEAELVSRIFFIASFEYFIEDFFLFVFEAKSSNHVFVQINSEFKLNLRF